MYADTTRFITPGQPEWPDGMRDLLDEQPEGLWVRGMGNLRHLSLKSVSITGSRACTMYGEQVALDMAQGLNAMGHTMVTGGAYGIDAAILRGAMHRPSIVVLPCSVDRVYPAAHESLIEGVLAAGGVLVSELDLGTAPSRTTFLGRFRTMAALSQGTVIVEAGVRSGAMVAAARASEIGRLVMAVPGPVTSVTSAGTNGLIAAGHALVSNASDVDARLHVA